MENWGGLWGTITTVTRATFAIAFNVILPMRSKNNSVGRGFARFAVHLEVMKMGQLLTFASFPLGPGGKLLKFAASKPFKSLFFRGGSTGRNGIEVKFQLVRWKIVFGEVVIGETDGGNMSNIARSK